MLICEGDCTSPLIGDDEIVSGIVYYHVLRHDKYYVFALNSLPVNPIPQTLPIWRITPLSKCLVKGYTKPFITKPYSGDLLPMILNHLHVMG